MISSPASAAEPIKAVLEIVLLLPTPSTRKRASVPATVSVGVDVMEPPPSTDSVPPDTVVDPA